MRRPRLYRSLVLWAGIVMMAFLGWAWWMSWHKVANLWIGDWRFSCAYGGALISWSSGHSGGMRATCEDHVYIEMEYTARDVLWPQGYRGKNLEPGAFLRAKSRENPKIALSTVMELYVVNQAADAWVLCFPFPFLLLATFLMWLGALAWRARRLRRLDRSLAMET